MVCAGAYVAAACDPPSWPSGKAHAQSGPGQSAHFLEPGRAGHLDGVAVADENLLLVDVEVDRRDDGEVGGGPLVEVDDELEGDVGQLLADGGQHEGTVGGEAQEGPIEGAEDAATRRQAVGGPGAEAAAHPVAQRAFLIRLALPRVALDQVASEAAAAPSAVAVPEQLLGLQERRLRKTQAPGEGGRGRG